MDKYEVNIGLEMHCEVSETNTKVFSSAENSYNNTPNTNIRPVDMAFPGTLPVVNKEAIRMALMASMILNCKQPKYMYFERKHYYYPDLPKGFQITQETKPIPVGIYGQVEFECDGELKCVRVNNLHLEEDAASLDHYYDSSRVDYNRAGVPLLELVTEPDLHSASEAVAFLEHMRSIYQYAGISEGDSKKGQIRCDVNISIKEIGSKTLGTKVEIKNVNSFGGVREAINYEIKIQTEMKENNTYKEMQQQTKRWDEESGTTIFMRSKVDAVDYKYFVEPNLPKFKISDEWLAEIKKSIPLMPLERKNLYIKEYDLNEYDANVLIKEKDISDYFQKCVMLRIDPKIACNYITTQILGYVNNNEINIKNIKLLPETLKVLIEKMNDGTISSKQVKELINKCLEDGIDPVKELEKGNFSQISDEGELTKIIDNILANNTSQVEDYKNGKTNLFDFFVGQVMKETRGKANPVLTKEILTNKLK